LSCGLYAVSRASLLPRLLNSFMAEIAGLMTASEAVDLCGLQDSKSLGNPYHLGRSRAVHHGTHLMDLGRLKPDSVQVLPEIRGYLESYENWKREHPLTVLKREEHVIHFDPAYQVLLDWRGFVDAGHYVMDVRIGEQEDWHRYHTALLGLAWCATNPGKRMPRRAALYLDPKGGKPAIKEHIERVDVDRAKAIVTVAHILRRQNSSRLIETSTTLDQSVQSHTDSRPPLLS
jgi:hypothetical protein